MTLKKDFSVKGMVCTSCEKIIATQALALEGVQNIDVDYVSGKGQVTFDEHKTSWGKIKHRIEQKGYACGELDSDSTKGKTAWTTWILIGTGILLLSYFGLQLYTRFPLPEITQNMGYGLLFLVGLLTGFHCIAMCGGFVVSYTTKGTAEGKKPHQLHASYAIGKTLSYTAIGALFGLLGSIIAFTPATRGIAGIIAGLFLIIFGIKMLDIFPFLRRFQFGLPKFLNRWLGKESQEYADSPLVIGLLNGLMIACGPLQAVYILAAGTGSMLEGAKMLFIFGLGTLPVMLGFGYFASRISSKATMKILKASGVLVIILGLIMLNRGLALTGGGFDFSSLTSGFGSFGNGGNSGPPNAAQTIAGTTFKDGYQEIKMTVDNSGFTPNKFVLKKGVPVKWIIDGKQLNGCNSAITVPKYGLNFKVQPGTQTIEFTPTESGTVSWSCWMGMLRGTFVVQDEVDSAAATEALSQVPAKKGGSCGMGGGCGCGG
ncbi:sulfite exporter TauE/SafE family protein [Candidatus Woesearchaeota archaeon]|nr:sulfite exporter TauE/SafE family protein [Candidatus Woesearchaeota archaeon]